MKNKILFDHFNIAVSEDEFAKWVQKSKEIDGVIFKQVDTGKDQWEFVSDLRKLEGQSWFTGFFSDETESRMSFIWFMEYMGKYCQERSVKYDFENSPEMDLIIQISENESIDLKQIFENVGINVKEQDNGFSINDEDLNCINFVIDNCFTKRICLEI